MRIQGRFTKLPQGTLYMGAELPVHMKLGTSLRPMSLSLCHPHPVLPSTNSVP